MLKQLPDYSINVFGSFSLVTHVCPSMLKDLVYWDKNIPYLTWLILCYLNMRMMKQKKKKIIEYLSSLNMSKGMPNFPWNMLELWMERGNLISFGNILKIFLIKIKHRTFGNTDGKISLKQQGKWISSFCTVFILLKIYIPEIVVFEIWHINISILNWKCDI